MRLINVETLELESFIGDKTPPYAILSHRWGSDEEEVSFDDMKTGNTKKSGMEKVMRCCAQAKEDKINYAWIDTCCINKDSSKELDEAINSMFQWYRNASVCYTYLVDVPQGHDVWDPKSKFSASSWFQRGWALQELLAPEELRFYDQQWNFLGTKADFSSVIERNTGISPKFLLGWVDLHQASVAQRMSWASKRETKREEDMAYCLLGIFNITMPMIYGEGSRAFQRLQLKIMQQVRDDSLLAWGMQVRGTSPEVPQDNISAGLFAPSPADFAGCEGIVAQPHSLTPSSTFIISGGCVRTSLVLLDVGGEKYGLLNCGSEYTGDGMIGIPLHPASTDSPIDEYIRPQRRPALTLGKSLVKGPSREIRIQINRQAKPCQATGRRVWLHIDGHQELKLSLKDTWPPLRWEKGRALIADIDDQDQPLYQRYLIRFSSTCGLCDIVTVLDLDITHRQPSVTHFALRETNRLALDEIEKKLDFMDPSLLSMKVADNGQVGVLVTVEQDEIAQGSIFSLKLSRTSMSGFDEDLDKELVLASLKQQFMASLYREDRALSTAKQMFDNHDNAVDHLEALKRNLGVIEEREKQLAEERAMIEMDIDYAKDKVGCSVGHVLHARKQLEEYRTEREKRQKDMDAWATAQGPGNWFEMIIQGLLDRHRTEKQTKSPKLSGPKRIENQNRNAGADVPLLWAAANGQDAVARLLMEKHPDTEVRDDNDNTALLLAASNGRHSTVELLLKHNAQLEAKNKDGDTPLARAAYKGYTSIAALLLDSKANIEARNNAQSTPLAIAARQGHVDVVELLLRKGADPEVRNEYGDTPISRAATHGHVGVVQVLLGKSVSIVVENKKGLGPLQLAEKNGHEEVVQLLRTVQSEGH
ncbi:hypothetical protein F66182_6988 [Fusarium sp. NRRL 66182]|nr:hypothetical protein F66182_6988 [Fusarium sp. NRRL 66182]